MAPYSLPHFGFPWQPWWCPPSWIWLPRGEWVGILVLCPIGQWDWPAILSTQPFWFFQLGCHIGAERLIQPTGHGLAAILDSPTSWGGGWGSHLGFWSQPSGHVGLLHPSGWEQPLWVFPIGHVLVAILYSSSHLGFATQPRDVYHLGFCQCIRSPSWILPTH